MDSDTNSNNNSATISDTNSEALTSEVTAAQEQNAPQEPETAHSPETAQDVQIIEDEHGLLVLGEDAAVDSWLNNAGLREHSREIKQQALHAGSKTMQTLGELASQNGRWVKLT